MFLLPYFLLRSRFRLKLMYPIKIRHYIPKENRYIFDARDIQTFSRMRRVLFFFTCSNFTVDCPFFKKSVVSYQNIRTPGER